MAQNTPTARPLSPHLQIYRPMLSMMLSIMHRITGAGLYFGMAPLVLWLVAAASGPESFAVAQAIAGSILGQIVLFAATWALIHHTLGGVRHLIWDMGYGFDLPGVEFTGRIIAVLPVLLTILIWVAAYFKG